MKRRAGLIPDVADPEFAPFWDAARDERLVIPQCGGCARFVWPPRPICPHCYADVFTWVPVAATGTLFSWTVAHHPTVDSMDPGYIVAIVELDKVEGVRLLGNIWDFDPADLRVGMMVDAQFDEVSEACTLVNWTVVRES